MQSQPHVAHYNLASYEYRNNNLKRIDCVYRSNLKPKRNLHLQEETSWL